MSNLFNGILKTGIGVIANLFLGVISIKIMAVMLGPSGTGLFSIIRQAISTMSSIATGGQTALVQGVASKKGASQINYVRSTFWLYIIASVFSIALIYLFADRISFAVFEQSDTSKILIVKWISLPVFLTFIYIYLKSLLNGYRAIGRLAIVELIGPLTTLVFVYPACIAVGEGNIQSFIWLLSTAQLAMIAGCFMMLYNNKWLPTILINCNSLIEMDDFKYFFKITNVTFLTSIITAATLFTVRGFVANQGGLHLAGLFDLAWTLSGSYVMIILSSFGTYYMPTLAQTVGNKERGELIRQVFKIATLIMIPLVVIIIVIKPLLISILYSREYISSLEQVRWMLIGDYLKITSWILAMPAIVNLNMRIYFWTETFWNVGFLMLAPLTVYYFQSLEGIGIAFIFLYLVLTIYYFEYTRRLYGHLFSSDVALPWLTGFFYVIIVSIEKWNETSVNFTSSLLWISGGFFISFSSLNNHERLTIKNKARKFFSKNTNLKN